METNEQLETTNDAFARVRDAMDDLQQAVSLACSLLIESLEEDVETEPNGR